VTVTQAQDLGLRAVRGLAAVNAGAAASAVGFGLMFRVTDGSSLHRARLWMWLLVVVLVAAAVTADGLLSRRRGQRLTLGVAVADGFLVVVIAATGFLLTLGWWFLLAAAGVLLVAYLTWLGRSRTLAGRWDGPLLVSSLLSLLAYASSQRPWNPSSAQWPLIAAVAAAAAAVGAVSSVQLARTRGPFSTHQD
jgi:hypothetical protein